MWDQRPPGCGNAICIFMVMGTLFPYLYSLLPACSLGLSIPCQTPAPGEGRQLSASPAPAPPWEKLLWQSQSQPPVLWSTYPSRRAGRGRGCGHRAPPGGGGGSADQDEATAAPGRGNHKEGSPGPVLRGCQHPGWGPQSRGHLALLGESWQAVGWPEDRGRKDSLANPVA